MTEPEPTLSAPFPYFGGKATVAPEIWRWFGQPSNYIEPFCGSAAVLLCRPPESRPDRINIETINDMDGFVVNFWRAVTADPGAVAEAMNYPVCEADLEARQKWLCKQPEKDGFLQRMKDDPDLYDVKRAAWWCWGLAQWIGSGWCEGEWFGPGVVDNHGPGVCNNAAKRPHLGRSQGVHKKRPHLGDAGRGVHKQKPGQGGDVGECERRGEVLRHWMQRLADRLRNVRVCCGDWKRVCGSEATTTHHGLTACFCDPPYSAEAGRDNNIYREDCGEVAHRVREWCLERGDDPLMRIALCGYRGEGHEPLEDAGWSAFAWSTNGGYANVQKRGDVAKANKLREVIWFSPHCIDSEPDPMLFD